ncbi:MAG TPA: FAD:protein FMN transferase, partial [Solirubrobacteraceae bacterium]|nr:FAD:protein FMN transferase [Solirubrobacteraceae bacterium]
EAVLLARRALLSWHARFSRFLADSELSRVNADPRATLRVHPLMARLALAARYAGRVSGGLVDATLVPQLRDAGYARDLRERLALESALALAPARAPARASADARWRALEVDVHSHTLTRPPGVQLDSGGLAKGMFADVLGAMLASHASFAVDCAGDLLVGGAAGTPRPIHIESPFDASVLHTFELARTGVATSGIGRRSWIDDAGRPAHHLLDPATGRPAFTGVVQVSALAPSALAAEVKAKAALLSGPRAAAGWLTHGGVIVFDDGAHRVVQPPPPLTLAQLRPRRPRASVPAR